MVFQYPLSNMKSDVLKALLFLNRSMHDLFYRQRTQFMSKYVELKEFSNPDLLIKLFTIFSLENIDCHCQTSMAISAQRLSLSFLQHVTQLLVIT